LLVIASAPDISQPLVEFSSKGAARIVLPASEAAKLRPGASYYWKVIARNAVGATESLAPAKQFHIDPTLPPLSLSDLSEYGEGAGAVVVRADLAGDPKPSYGKLLRAEGFQSAAGPDGKTATAIQLDGKKGMLVYGLRAFPVEDYTVALWVA
jgi:hypothetical protein